MSEVLPCLGSVTAPQLPSGLRLPSYWFHRPAGWSLQGHVCLICLPRVEPTEAGDYRLCFDNSFSTISEKLVFFELIFDSFQDEEEVEGWAEAVEPEEMLDVKMEDIKVSGVSWCVLIVQVLRRLRQDFNELKANLIYIARSHLAKSKERAG